MGDLHLLRFMELEHVVPIILDEMLLVCQHFGLARKMDGPALRVAVPRRQWNRELGASRNYDDNGSIGTPENYTYIAASQCSPGHPFSNCFV